MDLYGLVFWFHFIYLFHNLYGHLTSIGSYVLWFAPWRGPGSNPALKTHPLGAPPSSRSAARPPAEVKRYALIGAAGGCISSARSISQKIICHLHIWEGMILYTGLIWCGSSSCMCKCIRFPPLSSAKKRIAANRNKSQTANAPMPTTQTNMNDDRNMTYQTRTQRKRPCHEHSTQLKRSHQDRLHAEHNNRQWQSRASTKKQMRPTLPRLHLHLFWMAAHAWVCADDEGYDSAFGCRIPQTLWSSFQQSLSQISDQQRHSPRFERRQETASCTVCGVRSTQLKRSHQDRLHAEHKNRQWQSQAKTRASTKKQMRPTLPRLHLHLFWMAAHARVCADEGYDSAFGCRIPQTLWSSSNKVSVRSQTSNGTPRALNGDRRRHPVRYPASEARNWNAATKTDYMPNTRTDSDKARQKHKLAPKNKCVPRFRACISMRGSAPTRATTPHSDVASLRLCGHPPTKSQSDLRPATALPALWTETGDGILYVTRRPNPMVYILYPANHKSKT